MTPVRVMRVRRPDRRGAHGQSLVFVALAGVALIGMTGLALDGGYEVGVYRSAQNGADAGALAAARAIYENQANSTYLNTLNSGAGLCGLNSGVAPAQVVLNNSKATPTCTAKTLTTYKPVGPDGFHSYGALATIDSSQSVSSLGVNVATLAAHVGVNEATGDVTQNPTPAASGSVDLASLSASLTAISNSLLSTSGSAHVDDCSSSASGAGNSQIVPSAGGSCPGSSLALTLALTIALLHLNVDVDSTLGLTGNIPTSPASISLVKQALSSVVPNSGIAQQRDFTQVAGAGATIGALGTV
ncbi:MAG TPA: pilus assembly protein TadG-related protein, partial [Candidatus Dormibacteraeota bacterium]|nr:pilus assembly protein TadG-related protein [Candidatus Dormibacteraeota bacterium]